MNAARPRGADLRSAKLCACALLLLFFWPAARLFAQQPAHEEGPSRFRAVDIYVDSHGTPLAAYQLMFTVTNGAAKITGIEGGEHPAFHEPPYYDLKAMQKERVIIAAFSTLPMDKLPNGKTRVATIHLQTTSTNRLQCELRLQVAGNSQGVPIKVLASHEERKQQ